LELVEPHQAALQQMAAIQFFIQLHQPVAAGQAALPIHNREILAALDLAVLKMVGEQAQAEQELLIKVMPAEMQQAPVEQQKVAAVAALEP
jgi:hypothetical protein